MATTGDALDGGVDARLVGVEAAAHAAQAMVRAYGSEQAAYDAAL